MGVKALDIDGAFRFDLLKRGDKRGTFTRVFCADTLAEQANLQSSLKHINCSVTAQKGSIRGLRYQVAPALEVKVVTCLRGRVFDVMVDLRKGSKTFMKVQANEISADAPASILVPQGVAHGFQTLEDNTEILYMTTQSYSPDCERSVRYSDPLFNIKWPLDVTDVSERDVVIPYLEQNFPGVDV